MAKRGHLIDKDVDTFFNDSNWEDVLKKKIINWQNAMSQYGVPFFSLILHRNPRRVPLANIIQKLENAGYQFSEKDYFATTKIIGNLDDNQAKQYIELYNTLKHKGIILNNSQKQELAKFFNNSFSNKLYSFFASEGIEPDWSSITKAVYMLGTESTDFFTEIFGQQYGENSIAALNDMFSGMFGMDGFDKSAESESKDLDDKISFVIDYLESHIIDEHQKTELFQNIYSPQHRLEAYIAENHPNMNFIEMLDLHRNTSPKPKKWFTDHQIKLIEYLEQKFNLEFLEKAPNLKKNFNI